MVSWHVLHSVFPRGLLQTLGELHCLCLGLATLGTHCLLPVATWPSAIAWGPAAFLLIHFFGDIPLQYFMLKTETTTAPQWKATASCSGHFICKIHPAFLASLVERPTPITLLIDFTLKM